MENPKIIICDCDHKDVETEKAVFDAAGMDFKWLHCTTQEAVIEQCQGAVCFLNQYTRMDKKIFEAIPTLKFIVRYGVGVDNVNLADATEYGVQVCNVPDYGTNEVADQALGLMLSLTRKVHMIGNMTKAGVWNYIEAVPVHRLSTRTVGLIGAGRIGQAFAHRVYALGCKVIAYDAAYGKMKEGAYFLNVARGGLVDEEALERALSSGKLAGAGIDVVCAEPLSKDSPLFQHENVVVTPHMGWYSEESAVELNRKCAEETVRFLKGEPVHYPVNTPKK